MAELTDATSMPAGLWAQYAVIALALAASLYYMLGKLAPKWRARGVTRLAGWMRGDRRAAPVRAVGRWLDRTKAAEGCDTGCGACSSGCGPADDTLKPVKIERRKPLR